MKEGLKMIITIVGLGLIGGSMARRLRGFNNAVIRAYDKNPNTLTLVKKDGVADEFYTDSSEAVKDADLVILCLYPELNVKFIKENAGFLKPGCVITDVSGVKEYVCEEIMKVIPEGVNFVGGHPMAGRETSGYESSTDTLFNNASYLVVPVKNSKPESVALIRDMASYIGCNRIMTTSAHEHDEIIAYTSQLMHVVAVALCNNPIIKRSSSFSAGSLRDCTRVAVINENMWSELFCENKKALADRITEMQQSLEDIKKAVLAEDKEELKDIMRKATDNKMKWLMD